MRFLACFCDRMSAPTDHKKRGFRLLSKELIGRGFRSSFSLGTPRKRVFLNPLFVQGLVAIMPVDRTQLGGSVFAWQEKWGKLARLLAISAAAT
jgi:hypothetical protein